MCLFLCIGKKKIHGCCDVLCVPLWNFLNFFFIFKLIPFVFLFIPGNKQTNKQQRAKKKVVEPVISVCPLEPPFFTLYKFNAGCTQTDTHQVRWSKLSSFFFPRSSAAAAAGHVRQGGTKFFPSPFWRLPHVGGLKKKTAFKVAE